ncbi:MAG: hypothetical protein CW694_01850 [Candidatus Syntrophoarchaeum sp. WYZ-LMO15]|nr:MAG: hypothetical protein CW694_01850 [Candidatus Syntrophoarchaeum sp. WYZ-LMO15]
MKERVKLRRRGAILLAVILMAFMIFVIVIWSLNPAPQPIDRTSAGLINETGDKVYNPTPTPFPGSNRAGEEAETTDKDPEGTDSHLLQLNAGGGGGGGGGGGSPGSGSGSTPQPTQPTITATSTSTPAPANDTGSNPENPAETEIPEFTTVALPLAATIALFIFFERKR